MNGANYGGHFQPQPTSYDYDSPMDERGAPNDKFFALRAVLSKHLAPGETLPDVPSPPSTIAIPDIELTESGSLFDNLGGRVQSEKPLSFEDLNQGYGFVLYRTQISGPAQGRLTIKSLRDFAVVWLDGRRVAALDRRHNQNSVELDVTNNSSTLDILVENCGRINYGPKLMDNRKGITESVLFGSRELEGWQMFRAPFDTSPRLRRYSTGNPRDPAIYRGTFSVAEPGDTYLDMREWGKGIVLVNGHNLGRYWQIGPQQTLYVPGVWLKKGRNDVVVFEELKNGVHRLAGITTPILDQLNEEDFKAPRRAMTAPKLESTALVKEGTLGGGRSSQEITFEKRRARYLCLQALSSQNGDDFTTLAEIDALDTNHRPVSRDGWKILYVDSEETSAEDSVAENAIDGDTDSYWHSAWSLNHSAHPHTLVIDMNAVRELSGVRLLPRQDSANGRIKNYRLYLSESPF
jgi:beta-galactosidase